ELKKWQKMWALLEMDELLRETSQVGSVRMVRGKWDNVDAEVLREAAEKLRDRLGKGIVILASVSQDKALFVAASTQKEVPANLMIKEIAQLTGGNGGGRWDFAQGGTSHPSRVEGVWARLPQIITALTDSYPGRS
ncbi:hypothetical protein E3J48_04630, partial [Candidatus Aerophobetes bacterium]